MKTDKRYWFVLIIPIAAIIAIAVFLIPGHKHHDWDDDEEEEEEILTERSGFDITEEDIAAIPVGAPPVWGGNSPAVHVEPVPGITIDARENAFDRPTTVKFRPATTEEHEELSEAISQQLPSQSLLFAFDLDAGIEPMHRAPGNFSVELDLEELDIPEELWSQLCVCRLDESGIVQQYSRTLNDGIFRFESSKNCLWGITIGGLILASGVERACYLTALGVLPGIVSWWDLDSEYHGNCVELGFNDNRTGQFTIGFDPYATEHPHPDKYLKGLKRTKELADSLRTRAKILLSDERMQEHNPAFSQWPNNRAINYSIRLEAKLQELIEVHPELQRLLNDTELDTPKSIDDISKMIRYAKCYLKDVAQVKEPGEISKFYLGSGRFTGGQYGCYNHYLDLYPMIAIKYTDHYVKNKQVQTGTLHEDIMKVSIGHELFHHHQSAYVAFSLFRSKTWDECTASVLERDYAQWLFNKGKLMHNPQTTNLDWADRDHKEWLFAPLDNSLIVPTGFDFSAIGQLYRKTGLKLLVDIKDMIKGNRPVNLEEIDRVFCESVLPLYPINPSMLHDIFGYCEIGIQNYANCDKGYMLGELYEYIRDKYVPNAKLHDFLMYGTGFTDMMLLSYGWNIANAFKKGFHKDDVFLSKAFEEYCLTVMKQIVSRQQWLMLDGENFGRGARFYKDQAFMPDIPVSRQRPMVKLQCWERAGMFACRTAKLMPNSTDGNYNLLIIPHMDNGKEKAVKASILREDSLYAPNPYYLECDSNGMKSPTSVAMLFTDKMKNVSLSLDDYYTAVAYYEPKTKPTVRIESGGVTMELSEEPQGGLVENGLLTGLSFTVRNNKTGRENTIFKPVTGPRQTSIAIPDWQPGEEADITAYCRWYYLPDPDNHNIIYYSPKSEEVTANGDAGESAEVVFDQSVRITSLLMDLSLTSPMNERDARDAGMTEEEHQAMNDDYARAFRCDARLCLRKDGTFTVTIPPMSGSFDKNYNGEAAHVAITTSGATFEGKGEWHYDSGNPYSRLTVGNAAMEAATFTQRWTVTGHDETSSGNYDLSFTASGGTYDMTVEIKDGKCKDFKITFSKCRVKGSGSDSGQTASIDENMEGLSIEGRQ